MLLRDKSQARSVSALLVVPAVSVVGWKYTRVSLSAARLRALVLLRLVEAMDCQVVPLDAELAEVFGTHNTFSLFVRPDNYIAFITTRDDPWPEVRSYLRDVLATRGVLAQTDTALTKLRRELAAIRHEEKPTGHVRAETRGMFGRLRDAFNGL